MIFTACATLTVSAVFIASMETANQLPEWYLKNSDLAETHEIITKAKETAEKSREKKKIHFPRKSSPATLSLHRNLANEAIEMVDLSS